MTTDEARRMAENNGFSEPCWYEIEHCVLDIAWWQALAKGMGWDDYADFCSNCREFPNGYDCPMKHCHCPSTAWQYYWYKLVDHLSEGKTIESYFESLTK